jgi:hypothetical protein
MASFDPNKIRHQIETITLDDETQMERVWVWAGRGSYQMCDYVDIPYFDGNGLPTTQDFRKTEIMKCYYATKERSNAEGTEAKIAQQQESQGHLCRMEMLRQVRNERLQVFRPTPPTPQHVARDLRDSQNTTSPEAILANARRSRYNGSSHGSSHGSSRGSSHGSSMLPRQRLRLSSGGVNQSNPSSTDASRPTIDTGSTDPNNNDILGEEITAYYEIEPNTEEDDSTNDSTAATSRPVPPRILSSTKINQNRVRFGIPMPTPQHFQVPPKDPNVEQKGQ